MILVTGGAGFIGSSIVWELNRRGVEDILIADHLGISEKWKNLRALKYTDYFEKNVLLEHIIFDSLPYGIDCIIHMGACSSTTETDCSYLAANNFEYTKVLAEYCSQKNIKMIYASSAATYGDGGSGFSDDHEKLNIYRPLNMYGYSKQMFDLFAEKKGLLSTITGIKFFNVYGPNEYHKGEMSSKIFKAFNEIKKYGSIKLFKSYNSTYADGESVRDFVYVKDCAKIVCDMIDKKNVSGIYNLGSGAARSWNDLAKAVFRSMELDESIEYFDMPPQLRDKYQYFTESDNSKLKKAGLNAFDHSLEEGIDDYIKNYLLKNKHLGD
ncbi:MAG: ADP-glyceromanno-heptose 6-epimerase [Candidatus Delongbacteria bacterium]